MNKHYGKQGIRFLQLQFEIGDITAKEMNGIFWNFQLSFLQNTFAKLQKSSFT